MLIFLIIVISEIYSLFFLSSQVGFLYTFLEVILSSFLGLIILKYQWLFFFQDLMKKTFEFKSLSQSSLNVLSFFLAGIFFLIPGLLTDFFALMLLIPWTRDLFFLIMRKFFKKKDFQNHFFVKSIRSRYSDENHIIKDVSPKK